MIYDVRLTKARKIDSSLTDKVLRVDVVYLVLGHVQLVEVLQGADGLGGDLAQVVPAHVEPQQVPGSKAEVIGREGLGILYSYILLEVLAGHI